MLREEAIVKRRALRPMTERQLVERAYKLAYPPELEQPQAAPQETKLAGNSVTTYERHPATDEIIKSTQTYENGARVVTDFIRDPQTQEILSTKRRVFPQ